MPMDQDGAWRIKHACPNCAAQVADTVAATKKPAYSTRCAACGAVCVIDGDAITLGA